MVRITHQIWGHLGHLEGEQTYLEDLRSPWLYNHLRVLGWSSQYTTSDVFFVSQIEGNHQAKNPSGWFMQEILASDGVFCEPTTVKKSCLEDHPRTRKWLIIMARPQVPETWGYGTPSLNGLKFMAFLTGSYWPYYSKWDPPSRNLDSMAIQSPKYLSRGPNEPIVGVNSPL